MRTRFQMLIGFAGLISVPAGTSIAQSQDTRMDELEKLSPERAIKLSQSEGLVRAVIATCLYRTEDQAYYSQLSDRYLSFLAQYGRVTRSRLDAERDSRAGQRPDTCEADDVKQMTQELRERETALRPLIVGESPQEPPPAPLSDGEPSSTSSSRPAEGI